MGACSPVFISTNHHTAASVSTYGGFIPFQHLANLIYYNAHINLITLIIIHRLFILCFSRHFVNSFKKTI